MAENPDQLRAFVKYCAAGTVPKLVNDHEEPLEGMVHPLVYAKDPQHHPEILSIPMGYHLQRQYSTFITRLLKG